MVSVAQSQRAKLGFWRIFVIPESGRFACLFLILTLLLMAFFLHPDFDFRGAGIGGSALQRAFSASRFKTILLSWRDVALFKQTLRQIDFLLPLVYAAGLSFALGWSLRRREPPAGWRRFVVCAPWLAALCDYLENGLHLFLLRGVVDGEDVRKQVEDTDFPTAWVVAASCFASVKWVLLVATALAIIIFASCELMRHFRAGKREQWRVWLERWLDNLPYVYLLRFPLLARLFLLGFPFLACFTGARSLLEGLFDLPGQRIFWTSLTAFLLAWASMATERLLLVYGPRRFGITSLAEERFGWGLFIWHGCLALPIIFTAIVLSRSGPAWPPLGGLLLALTGLLAALWLLYVATWLHLFFSPLPEKSGEPPCTPAVRNDFLLPASFPGQRWLNRVYIETPPPVWVKRFHTRLARLPEYLRIGYVDDVRGQVHNGHLLATALLALSLLVYVWAGLPGYQLFSTSWWSLALPYLFLLLLTLALLYVARQALTRAAAVLLPSLLLLLGLFVGHLIRIPALAYLLWLCLLLCWGLAALAYFFDRYRLPVLIPLVLWLTVTAQFFDTDHYYQLLPATQAQAGQPLSPAQVVQPNQPAPLIVIAISGGGIQAAAWAAHVLTGLEAQNPRRFSQSVRLISAVSGGSVGAMYFANAYQEDGSLNQATLPQIVAQATHSSLDAVGWGLVYPDFLRLTCPLCVGKIDRGQALEQAWLQADGMAESRLPVATLGQWKNDAQAGRRPAIIFNTTITDTGERLLLATSASSEHADSAGSRSFARLYSDKDLRIVTAARLSATFPYASPAARADAPGAQYHIVDGGYYDNFGISSLAQWLLEAQTKDLLKRVMVLQIRASADNRKSDPPNSSEPESPIQRGWFYEAFAPVSTLLNVRKTGQSAHNEIELDLLEKVLKQSGITLERALFEFRGKTEETDCPSQERNYSPPLSWHLTQHQKEELRREWQRLSQCSQARKVKTFLTSATTLPTP